MLPGKTRLKKNTAIQFRQLILNGAKETLFGNFDSKHDSTSFSKKELAKGTNLRRRMIKELDIGRAEELVLTEAKQDASEFSNPNALWKKGKAFLAENNYQEALSWLQKALVALIIKQSTLDRFHIELPTAEIINNPQRLNSWLNSALKYLAKADIIIQPSDAVQFIQCLGSCGVNHVYLRSHNSTEIILYTQFLQSTEHFFQFGMLLLQRLSPNLVKLVENEFQDAYERYSYVHHIIYNEVHELRELLKKRPDLVATGKISGGSTTTLTNACNLGFLEIAQILLQNGAKIDDCEPDKQLSPLHMACLNNNIQMLRYLLNPGLPSGVAANPNKQNPSGETVIDVYVGILITKKINNAQMFPEREREIIKLLRQHGGTFNPAIKINLRKIGRIDLILILEHKPKSQKQSTSSKPADPVTDTETITLADSIFDDEEKKANPGKKIVKKTTAHNKKYSEHRSEAIALLEEKEFSRAINELKKAATAQQAIQRNSPTTALAPLPALIEIEVLQAVYEGNLEQATQLIQTLQQPRARRDAINTQAIHSLTPLMLAASTVKDPKEEYFYFFKFLIEAQANIHLKDATDKTVLHHTAINNFDVAIEYLASVEPDQFSLLVDAKDELGRTALHYAAILGHAQTAKTLLAHHATPLIKDSDQRTAFDHANAIPNNPVTQVLQEAAKKTIEISATSLESKDENQPMMLSQSQSNIEVDDAFRLLENKHKLTRHQFYDLKIRCQKALDILRTRYKCKSDDLENVLQLEKLLRQLECHTEHQQLLNELIQKFPDNLTLQISSAHCDRRNNKSESAETKFKSVLAKLAQSPHPDDELQLSALFGLRLIYLGQKNFDKLAEIADRILAIRKNNVLAQLDKIRIDHHQGKQDHSTVLMRYNALLKLHPTNPQILNQIAWFYLRTKQYQKAIQYFEKLKDKDPVNHLFGLARCAEFMREDRDCENYYILLNKNFPDFYPGQLRAIIFMQRRYPNKVAITNADKKRMLAKARHEHDYFMLANYFWREHDYLGAINIYQCAFTRFPASIKCRLQFIYFNLSIGKIATAEEFCRTLLGIGTHQSSTFADTPEIYYAYIDVLLRKRDNKTALIIRQKCVVKFSQNHPLIQQIDDILKANGLRLPLHQVPASASGNTIWKPVVNKSKDVDAETKEDKRPDATTPSKNLPWDFKVKLTDGIKKFFQLLRAAGFISILDGESTIHFLRYRKSNQYTIMTTATADYLSTHLQAKPVDETNKALTVSDHDLVTITFRPIPMTNKTELHQFIIRDALFTQHKLVIDEDGLVIDLSLQGRHDFMDAIFRLNPENPKTDLESHFRLNPELILTIPYMCIRDGMKLAKDVKNQFMQFTANQLLTASHNALVPNSPDRLNIPAHKLMRLLSELFFPQGFININCAEYVSLLFDLGIMPLLFPGKILTANDAIDAREWIIFQLNLMTSHKSDWNAHNNLSLANIFALMAAYENRESLGTEDFITNVHNTLIHYGLDINIINDGFILLVVRYAIAANNFLFNTKEQINSFNWINPAVSSEVPAQTGLIMPSPTKLAPA